MTPEASLFLPSAREMVSQPTPSKRLSDQEHELHIFDTERLWRVAYQRWLDYRIPADRDEALLHLHNMNQAILARSRAVQEARHAGFERREQQLITEGVDYFGACGARDRLALERRTA